MPIVDDGSLRAEPASAAQAGHGYPLFPQRRTPDRCGAHIMRSRVTLVTIDAAAIDNETVSPSPARWGGFDEVPVAVDEAHDPLRYRAR